MRTMTTDVTTHIRTAYDSMSKSQQKVAEFLLTHGVGVVYLSAARIAEMTGVNASTVVRTAQALGFEGFAELQATLQDQLLRHTSPADRFQISSKQLTEAMAEGGESVLHNMVQTEIRNLESLLEQLPVADFDQAVESINAARRIYIIGMRNSLPLALNFAVLLRYIRPDVRVLEPGRQTLADQLEELGENDVLFSIAYGRYVRDTLRCMDYARTVSAKVIALTDSTLSPAAKRADLALIVPFRLWSFGNSLASFAVLNAIFGALFLRHAGTAQERLKHLDRIYEAMDVFEVGEALSNKE